MSKEARQIQQSIALLQQQQQVTLAKDWLKKKITECVCMSEFEWYLYSGHYGPLTVLSGP